MGVYTWGLSDPQEDWAMDTVEEELDAFCSAFSMEHMPMKSKVCEKKM